MNNILDESIEIDLEMMQTKKEEKKDKPPYEGVECAKSLYIFDKKNPMRNAFYKIIHSTKFETLIMIFILCSTIKLIMDTYLNNLADTDLVVVISAKFDYVFTTAFACESLMKVIALGLVQDKGSYLRETWS